MRRDLFVYVILLLAWGGIIAWQTLEHRRVRDLALSGQLNHARDIANSLAVVIRSQRRFGAVPRDRLVEALGELAKSSEILGIALLSPKGQVVAAGGQAMPEDIAGIAPGDVRQAEGLLTTAFLVELGPEPPNPFTRDLSPENQQRAIGAVVWSPEEFVPPQSDSEPEQPRTEGGRRDDPRRRHWDAMRRMHPFWQDTAKYQELYEKQGLHMMALALDHQVPAAMVRQDFLVRCGLVGLALIALLGFALAWRMVRQSADLQVRLVQARAMNSYLQELNLAAAGLAHETRNPLNIVRAATQLVEQDKAVPTEARQRLNGVLDEVDRITSRLNEFIDYSRPREPLLSDVVTAEVARDVARTLETDMEDKNVSFSVPDTTPKVRADAGMLRQVLFNLMLNAVQALPEGGRLELQQRLVDGKVELDVVDNGPGVPADAREEIFRPYFSLSEKGSGLGLAICRQIAIAHGWELRYLPAPEGGSIFRLSGLQPASG